MPDMPHILPYFQGRLHSCSSGTFRQPSGVAQQDLIGDHLDEYRWETTEVGMKRGYEWRSQILVCNIALCHGLKPLGGEKGISLDVLSWTRRCLAGLSKVRDRPLQREAAHRHYAAISMQQPPVHRQRTQEMGTLTYR
jgi:hypothetical protein